MLFLLERVPLDRPIARRVGELCRKVGLASPELTGRTLVTRNSKHLGPLPDDHAVELYEQRNPSQGTASAE
jgi:hypothetical protein